MRPSLFVLLLASVAFLFGCAQPVPEAPVNATVLPAPAPPSQPNDPAAPENATAPAGTNTTDSAPPSAAPALDKFSLWSNGTLLRGADIYQRHVYPDGYDDPEAWGSGPLGPVFTQEDFDALSAAGANVVVLSHPGLYDDLPPYALNKSVQDNLDRFIDMAQEADLFVVIAFRTGPGRSEFGFFGVEEDDQFGMSHLNDDVWKDKNAQDKWVEMWRYAAARYRNRSNVVGYELMVEPNSNGVWLDMYEPSEFYAAYGDTTYDWNQMHPRLSGAIREVDNDTPILIGGMSWSSVRWLPYIKAGADNRTVYTFHQYEPQEQYTHQAFGLGNGYPGRFDTDYDENEEDFDKAWIDGLLGTADDFKAERGAPVAVTEYGVQRWQPGAAEFLDDEMARFEESGMNYAIWSWQPLSERYNEAQNDFNFRLGPEPDDTSEGSSELYDAIKKYWKRNAVRPSSFSGAS
ncbi:MAG: cellulase family glycosylhydrolase [Candidatus Micrarchaeota archaeon]